MKSKPPCFGAAFAFAMQANLTLDWRLLVLYIKLAQIMRTVQQRRPGTMTEKIKRRRDAFLTDYEMTAGEAADYLVSHSSDWNETHEREYLRISFRAAIAHAKFEALQDLTD